MADPTTDPIAAAIARRAKAAGDEAAKVSAPVRPQPATAPQPAPAPVAAAPVATAPTPPVQTAATPAAPAEPTANPDDSSFFEMLDEISGKPGDPAPVA